MAVSGTVGLFGTAAVAVLAVASHFAPVATVSSPEKPASLSEMVDSAVAATQQADNGVFQTDKTYVAQLKSQFSAPKPPLSIWSPARGGEEIQLRGITAKGQDGVAIYNKDGEMLGAVVALGSSLDADTIEKKTRSWPKKPEFRALSGSQASIENQPSP